MKAFFSAPDDPYGYHRRRDGFDRGAVLIALAVALVAGTVTVQSFDSLAIGLVIGATLFALLAALLGTDSR